MLSLPPDLAVGQFVCMRENQWYERKSGRINPKDLAVPLVAMANAEGGYVVVGIHEGAVDGVREDRLNALRQTAHDYITPPLRCTATELRTSLGDVLLVLQVDPGERVHETTKGDAYLRIGDESRRLGFGLRRELEYDRSSGPFDGTGVDADIDDLQGEQVLAYQQLIGATTPEGMLTARDLLTRDGRLTVAGWLLFAQRPQSLFPSAVVRVLRYGANHRGTGSSMTLYEGGDIRCEGSIPQQIDAAAQVIEDWPRSFTRAGRLGCDSVFGLCLMPFHM